MENLNTELKATGKLVIQHFNGEGSLIGEYEHNNLVVTVGLAHIAARMAQTGIPTQMTHMAIGSGATAAAAGNTALQTQLGRVALTTAGGTPSSNSITYAASFPAGTGTGAVTEAGIFNDVTAGTMLCRTVFPVINKGADDVLAVSWVVTIN